ncbi:capsanthin/capsorubin synthase, chromoplastic-like [Populus alba]|uniref:capsanthin/capsorubin synthase, chromoplastic-like n=1 Tax=Populus alba TaxID=43335 RepID=UPI003CC79009
MSVEVGGIHLMFPLVSLKLATTPGEFMRATLFRLFPPAPEAKTFLLNHKPTPLISSRKPQTTASRKSHHGIQSSKLGSFLDLKPLSKPESLDFDLSWFDPADRYRCFDVIVIGTGPAGLRLAEQVSRHGVKVCCVDPSPLSMWPSNYGVWVDEFESLGLVDCLDKTWPMTCVYIDDDKTKYLDRPMRSVHVF